ncbi:hypothetical protein SASPL_128134 [Salvia splendens]|uniref:Cyclin-dependent protein kinase inhibitor SMR1 n=1 Tax=Salvia splendens TaxID=180675 RepID=A0A8X8XEI6_SALSN|nr:hypothetical protein SASPL_128134 [Salvia splendens]
MSADLELRLPIIKLRNSASEIGRDDLNHEVICRSEEEEGCQTPRSPRHMIPAVLRCPPAPKKRRRAAACKRRLFELDFFKVVAREEVDSFFRGAQVKS